MTGWKWRVTDMAPPHWPRTWAALPDARSLANVREWANHHSCWEEV